MLQSAFVGDTGRKRMEADTIAGPARALQGRTLATASSGASRCSVRKKQYVPKLVCESDCF
jgi:hypothetical protein